MQYIIHHNGEYEDSIVVSGETLEEIRNRAFEICNMRGWKIDDCWSEYIGEGGQR